MSWPWWGREAPPPGRAHVAPATTPEAGAPRLVPGGAATLLAELEARIPAFTPGWTDLRPDDAGVALVRLFGAQLQPLLARLERLPEKAFGEFLGAAGVRELPASPARTLLQVAVADGAPRSVLVARGFQVGARPADGAGDLVIFETERELWAAPAKIDEIHVQEGRRFRGVDHQDGVVEGGFAAFGERPGPGRGLLVGLAGEAAPEPLLSLALVVDALSEVPPPISAGGLVPLPVAPPPVLVWEVLDGTRFEPAEVLLDETAGLAQSGVVELRVPRSWRPGRPPGLEGEAKLRWVRVRVVHGRHEEPPRLARVALNAVRAVAARTIRDEVLEHLPGGQGRLRLSQTPVVAGSLVLEVDETAASGSLFALDEEAGVGGARRWLEVDDLAAHGPEDRVFTLDLATGEISFGSGLHGAALPPGFRHVRAPRYQVANAGSGGIGVGAVTNLLHSAPFVTGVTNPSPVSGGTEPEARAAALRRGPQEIRTRGRAVTEADYELLAQWAPGAEVARAHAISGFHPAFPGLPIPGVVGVLVLPARRGPGPPVPDEETLRAVAEHLSRQLAPAGVEVVAAAPRFHRVRVEAGVRIDRTADSGTAIRRLFEELDLYLDPLTGGEEGEGWPFGGPIRHAALLRRLLSRVPEVTAVPRLNLVVDGVRRPACTDHPLSPHSLPWPAGHAAVPLEGREEP